MAKAVLGRVRIPGCEPPNGAGPSGGGSGNWVISLLNPLATKWGAGVIRGALEGMDRWVAGKPVPGRVTSVTRADYGGTAPASGATGSACSSSDGYVSAIDSLRPLSGTPPCTVASRIRGAPGASPNRDAEYAFEVRCI